MGKRSNFERKDRDLYITPFEAVLPLLPFLPQYGGTFFEPCAANGLFVSHFDSFMECVGASDIVPLADGIVQKDALDLTSGDLNNAEMIITNPPWARGLLHDMIIHFRGLGVPSWLLFDAGWKHTKQSAPFMPYVSKIVSVGRVKWFGNSSGFDDCCWYRFEPHKVQCTKFYGRK